MKVKEWQKSGIYNIGFMDSDVIHEESVRKWTNRIKNNIFMALDKQHTCTFILLLYNFQWVLCLFLSLQFDNNYISNISSIYVCINNFDWILLCIEINRVRAMVFDSLRKPKEDYQDLIDIMQKVWARFIKRHIGVTSTPCGLYFKLDFLVRIHIAHAL